MEQASLNGRQDLVAEVVAPTVLEARERLVEEAEELKSQIAKQAERLAELREKRVSDSCASSLCPDCRIEQ